MIENDVFKLEFVELIRTGDIFSGIMQFSIVLLRSVLDHWVDKYTPIKKFRGTRPGNCD